MTNDIKKAVGRPDNSAFIRRIIIYGIILFAMLFMAPSVFEKLMVPASADGMTVAWYAIFVPIALFLMAIGLFRCWRRRWPLAYMRWYKKQASDNGYDYCPRCGAAFVLKKRTRYHREKVGEKITTTTYGDGSKYVNREDIYGNVQRTHYYHQCTNTKCRLEAEQSIGQSHLPWKTKEIECLVCNDDSLLGSKHYATVSILASRLLFPIITILMIAICTFTIISYANTYDGEWTYATADREPGRSAEEYQSYLSSLNTEKLNWYMSYEKEPTDMLSYLADHLPGVDKSVGYSIESYGKEGGGATLCYSFEGYDAGTGMPDGDYTLTEVDGIKVLLDDTNKRIYKQGSEFYETYAPKLLTLTYDKAINAVFDRVSGGEHGIYGINSLPLEFVRRDNSMVYSYMLQNDKTKISNGEFRAVTLYPDEHMMERWIFSYDDNEFDPVDLEGYVYSDAIPEENDGLGQLIAKSSDGSGEYQLYKNGEVVLDIDVDYYPNGYSFEIDTAKEGFDKGFEEDAEYRVNTNAKTLTKISVGEDYREVRVDLPLIEHQDKYDFLLSIVPDLYIRRIIDMDKAELKREKLGFIKNYVMKDENGKITAEMKVAFGKIGEVIHHIGENEYVKIELAY